MNLLFNLLYLLPKNHVSRLFGWFVYQRLPFGFHQTLKKIFIRRFGLNMSESENNEEMYETLGHLFIRRLKPDSRPISTAKVISPVDGIVTQGNSLLNTELNLNQIKGRRYRFESLTAGGWSGHDFKNGWYATIYLTPRHYHWIHAPISGVMGKVLHVPGKLWPVNGWSVQHIDGLFVANERLIVEINNGPSSVLVVMVGATNVGKIHLTSIPGFSTNHSNRRNTCFISHDDHHFEKGDSLGYFSMGSTVVVIGNQKSRNNQRLNFQHEKFPLVDAHVPIKMGEPLLV